MTIEPVLVVISLALWLWLWGPFGAFLAVPILLVLNAVVMRLAGRRPGPADRRASGGAAGGAGQPRDASGVSRGGRQPTASQYATARRASSWTHNAPVRGARTTARPLARAAVQVKTGLSPVRGDRLLSGRDCGS